MVTIRVPTRSNRRRKDRARGFIMAYRLHPPHPAGRGGAGSGRVPGVAGGAAGGPAETAGDPAPACVAGLGRGRRGGGRVLRAAGDRAGRGGLGPGGAGRARLPHQPADRAAHRAVSIHAGPAAEDAGPRGFEAALSSCLAEAALDPAIPAAYAAHQREQRREKEEKRKNRKRRAPAADSFREVREDGWSRAHPSHPRLDPGAADPAAARSA